MITITTHSLFIASLTDQLGNWYPIHSLVNLVDNPWLGYRHLGKQLAYRPVKRFGGKSD